jgi:hypothetical protein
MSVAKEFKRWCLEESDLSDLNPKKVRDLIIKCFYEAQRETIVTAKHLLQLPSSDEDIHESVTLTIKSAFSDVGGDFEKPTKEDLVRVIEILASKAYSWGTPEEIIEYHKGQIQKALSLLSG